MDQLILGKSLDTLGDKVFDTDAVGLSVIVEQQAMLQHFGGEVADIFERDVGSSSG